MTRLFDLDTPDLDLSYRNIRAGASVAERRMRDALEEMWAKYEDFADPDFPDGFARDPDARFWEMFVGCQLLESGRTLMPMHERKRVGGQPDLCVTDGGRRIWIEAIAPDIGAAGPDQVRGPTPINEGGRFARAPLRQAQLRMTSALWTKTQKIETYLREGVIAEDEPRLIAIGPGRFGAYVSDDPPMILSAVFPIGAEIVTIDRANGEAVGRGFEPCFEIQRATGTIPRTAFLDDRFSNVSGVVWCRVGIGNMSRKQRPITFVHNPLAVVPMAERWGVWDREFVSVRDGDAWTATDILGEQPGAKPPE
jgi:hypothetical protein